MNVQTGVKGGQELNGLSVPKLLFHYRILLLVLVAFAVFGVMADHRYFPVYKIQTAVYLKSPEDSALQSISSKLAGLNGLGIEAKEVPDKYLQYLHSNRFYLRVAAALRNSPQFSEVPLRPFFARQTLWDWLLGKAFLQDLLRGKSPDPALTDDVLVSAIAYWSVIAPISADGIGISVATPDAKLTLLLARLLAQASVSEITDQELTEIVEAESYVGKEMESIKDRINMSDVQFSDLRKNNHFLPTEQGQTEFAAKVMDFKRELEEISVEIKQNQEFIKNLKSRSSEDKAEEQGAESQRFGISRQIRDLEKKNQYLSVRSDAIRHTVDNIVGSEDSRSDRKSLELRREMEIDYSLIEELKRQMFQIQILKIATKNRVYQMEGFKSGEVKRDVSLSKKLLIAMVACLLLGGSVVYLWELSHPKIHSTRDLEELGIACLAAIPEFRRKGTSKIGKSIATHPYNVDPAFSKEIKFFRARISHIVDDLKMVPQVISFVSAGNGDGKTTIAVALASSMAQVRQRTLLIGCDQSDGSIRKYFPQCEQSKGLASVLANPSTFGQQIIQNALPGLDILPSGDLQGLEGDPFATRQFLDFLEDLRLLYRNIVIDIADIGSHPEGIQIAKYSDTVFLLANRGVTLKMDMDKIADILREVRQGKIYSVLNRVAHSVRFPFGTSGRPSLSPVPSVVERFNSEKSV